MNLFSLFINQKQEKQIYPSAFLLAGVTLQSNLVIVSDSKLLILKLNSIVVMCSNEHTLK